MSKIKYHAYNLAAELHVANRDKGSFSGGSSSLVHVPLNAQGYIHTMSCHVVFKLAMLIAYRCYQHKRCYKQEVP